MQHEPEACASDLSNGSHVTCFCCTGIIILVKIAQRRRATEGAYHPSQQEMAAPRIDLGNEIKRPPEERLI